MTSIAAVRAELPLSSSNQIGFSGRISNVVARVSQAVASCFLWARDYAVGLSYTLKAVWFNDHFHRAVCLIPIAQRREVIGYVREWFGVNDISDFGPSFEIKAVAQIPGSERREIIHFAQRLQKAGGGRILSSDLESVIDTILQIDPREREDVIAIAEQIASGGMSWSGTFLGVAPWGGPCLNWDGGVKFIVETLANFSPAFRADFRRRQFPGLFPPGTTSAAKAELISAIKKIHDLHCEGLQGEVIKSELELVDFREGGVGVNGFEDWREIDSVIASLAKKPLEAESVAHWARELFDQDSTQRRNRSDIVSCLVACAKEEREEIVTYAKQMITRGRGYVSDIDRAGILFRIMYIPQEAREAVMSEVFKTIDSEFGNNRPEGFGERLPMIIQAARHRAGHYLSSESKPLS